MRVSFGAALAALVASSSTAAAECAENAVDLRGPFGEVRFSVAVADEPQERARGLMFVEALGAREGMLFVYERPSDSIAFWMRNTLIPLDMIFAAPDGTVTRIHENAIPRDETPIPGGPGVQYILEVPGGTSSRLGLSEGDEMRHPAFGEDAAWAC